MKRSGGRIGRRVHAPSGRDPQVEGRVARWPDRAGGSHILAYGHAPEEAEANGLIGTPDEIMCKLEALRRNGVEYVIMSCGSSRESLRRFAHEIMPSFSDEPAKFRTVPA